MIERLDFKSPDLSKRMNRLIQNFGKGVFREKLDLLREEYSIEVLQVNPAYTSQECRTCGYVDKNNRKDTNTLRDTRGVIVLPRRSLKVMLTLGTS